MVTNLDSLVFQHVNWPPQRDSKADVSSVIPSSERIRQILRQSGLRRKADALNVSFLSNLLTVADAAPQFL